MKILKQNRSETTIEPEIPLHELFPAMSTEMFKNPKTVHFEGLEKRKSQKSYLSEKKEPIIVDRNLDDMRHIAINTLIDAFLLQSININHIENLLKKNGIICQNVFLTPAHFRLDVHAIVKRN